MNKAVKKIRKIKDQIDKLEEKEDDLLNQLDEAIDELDEANEDRMWNPHRILFLSLVVVSLLVMIHWYFLHL